MVERRVEEESMVERRAKAGMSEAEGRRTVEDDNYIIQAEMKDKEFMKVSEGMTAIQYSIWQMEGKLTFCVA